jgi:hypothetical protein
MDALLELLFLICARERRYLKHRSIPTASNTPITTPAVVPMIRPSETPFILRIRAQIDPSNRDGTMLPPPRGRYNKEGD